MQAEHMSHKKGCFTHTRKVLVRSLRMLDMGF